MKKRIIIIGSIVITIIIIILLIGIITNNKSSNNINVNLDDISNNDYTIESNGIKLSNIVFKKEENKWVILIKLTNTSNNDITKEKNAYITLFDKDKNEIKRLDSKIQPIKVGESTNITINSFGDYSKVDSFTFDVEK